ncbi:hypothetical protein, partial [Vibrio sp. Y184]|uniref:hypothetical protein n=1 Tax=Vibrio sp. Y184 TaxID=3074705 RepID=UPI002966847C
SVDANVPTPAIESASFMHSINVADPGAEAVYPNNEPQLVDQETFDQHLQRLSELSVQALEELAEIIEAGTDISEE